jgi:mRNA-degrading endonuclease RelE of RelBE toxin-antitoxin system
MKIEVTLDNQPHEFIRRQPPDARKRLREAIHDIETGELFPEPLTDELEGFYKIRVDRYRLILESVPGKRGPGFDIVFAERRKVVYELFSQILGLQ